MNYKETLNKGLKRSYEVTVPSTDVEALVNTKILEIQKTIKMDGFRPGKVPTDLIKKQHGEQAHSEVLNDLINKNVSELVTENKLRPVAQPQVNLKEEKDKTKTVFTVDIEIFPEIKLVDFEKTTIENYTVKLEKAETKKRIDLIAKNQKSYQKQADSYKAKEGDSVVLDYEGTIDGKNFDGGKAEEQSIVIGAGQYLPDLEKGLIGLKAGDEKNISVKFPETYHAKEMQNADAVFACKIKVVSSEKETEINDAFAKSMGAADLKDFQNKVEEQMKSEYEKLSKDMSKKELFDILDKEHSFDLPEGLITSEFNNLKAGYLQDKNPTSDQHKKDIEKQEISKEMEKDFQEQAENRIKLGIVLNEIGQVNKIQVSQEEMQQALYQYAGNFPGQEQEVVEYFKKNPDAAMQIQAPLYENKVVDFVLSKVKLKNNELDLDSFIKIYNGLNNPVEKTKSKVVKKKTVKKETKTTALKKKKTAKVKK
ncbi:trigger factor [Pelagibacteraceae bacterium]|nr:trigger factor [Pelagibacteraceae bacterium]